jgi:hypothetical protein
MGRLTLAETAQARWIDSRESRLRRSLKHLGYDLVDAERRGRFQIVCDGTKVDETVGLNLAGVEQRIGEEISTRADPASSCSPNPRTRRQR